MPNYRINDRQKCIIRTFSKVLRDKPDKDKIGWSYNTMQSDDDDNRFDLAVQINIGISAVDKIQDIYKSDLKLFTQIGLITPIPGRKAFSVNARMVHSLAGKSR